MKLKEMKNKKNLYYPSSYPSTTNRAVPSSPCPYYDLDIFFLFNMYSYWDAFPSYQDTRSWCLLMTGCNFYYYCSVIQNMSNHVLFIIHNTQWAKTPKWLFWRLPMLGCKCVLTIVHISVLWFHKMHLHNMKS